MNNFKKDFSPSKRQKNIRTLGEFEGGLKPPSPVRDNDIDINNPDVISEDEVDFDSLKRKIRRSPLSKLAGVSKVATDSVTSGADISAAATTDFYTPWMSTDYFELPRSFAEERRWYRWFYDQDPIVGRCIDLKTYIPLSKVTLGMPKGSNHEKNEMILAFFKNMWAELDMYEKLIWILHEYNLMGEVLIYFEWDDEKNNWDKILILDPDICEVRYLPFRDETLVYLINDDSAEDLVDDAHDIGEDDLASSLGGLLNEVEGEEGQKFIQLNTDPRKGSFVKYFSRKRSPYRAGPGVSVLRRVLRNLLFRDKIRQALTQITSRHMTPVRLVHAEGLGAEQLDELRDQVDFALTGPDFSIITDFEVTWTEITAEGRLFDTTAIYEQSTEELLIGLGMPKELLTNEGAYSGGRISLQMLDLEYTVIRDLLSEMVGEVFRITAEKQGFLEKDPDTDVTIILYPPLKFSRMALRDYADMFDFFSNMVTNGQLDKGTLLEMFNIDPTDVANKQKEDFLTVSDNLSDELRRGLLGEVVSRIATETDAVDRIIEGYGLKRKTKEQIAQEQAAAGGGDLGGGMDMGGDMGGGIEPLDMGSEAEPEAETPEPAPEE